MQSFYYLHYTLISLQLKKNSKVDFFIKKIMIPSDIISKKSDGISLSKDEINWFISSYLDLKISDAQMASLLMAIYFQGLNNGELYEFYKNYDKFWIYC